MAQFIGPTNESGIKYTLTAGNNVAVFNDSTDPNYVGGLTADDAITGLDSAEIIESFTQRTEDDGALHGSFFFGRRPITMSGNIVPSSALDRATRVDRLKRVLSAAMRTDATLTFTPTGGEPCFINVRAQQPWRSKGKWVKEFFLSLVAADPRVYSLKRSTAYVETDGTSADAVYRRFTYSTGSAGTTLATRNLYLPPGTWRVKAYVRRSTAAGSISANLTPNSSITNPSTALTTGWVLTTLATVTTTNAESVATAVTLNLSAALTAGQYVDVGPLYVESDAGLAPSNTATMATNWAAGTGYTAPFGVGPSYYAENQGNANAPFRNRIIGPWTYAYFWDAVGVLTFYTAALGTDLYVADTLNRTLTKNGANSYGSLGTDTVFSAGLLPGLNKPYIQPLSGASAATRMETTWRNTYL